MALGVVFFLSCVYAGWVLTRQQRWEQQGFPRKGRTGIVKNGPSAVTTDLQVPGLEHYLQGISQRPVFKIAAVRPAGSRTVQRISRDIKDMLGDIVLLGIVSGDQPQAILEDKKSQKTFYVNKGDLIGDFRLEDIQDGRVVLFYNGQSVDLYL